MKKYIVKEPHFRFIPSDKLIQKETYKIKLRNVCYKGTFDFVTFDGYYRFIHLTNITNENKKHYGSLYFDDGIFFRFVPQKKQIQDAMERRAVNKIIEKLLGHKFDWYH